MPYYHFTIYCCRTPATNLNGPVNRRKHRRRFAARLVPDMTAMVGLSFLLVTFLSMAAQFAKPFIVQLSTPVQPTSDNLSDGFTCGGAMTLLLGKNHQVHYYLGLNSSELRPELHTTNLGPAGLRQVLLKLQQQNPNMVVLIKTTADAKYNDMVDVLDEMNITNQRRYALVDLCSEDVDLLKSNSI